MTTRVPFSAVLAMLIAVGSCAGKPSRKVTLGGQTVDPEQLTPDAVAREVTVSARGADTVYRAPILASFQDVDTMRGGPTLGRNVGTMKHGRQGFLFGVRAAGQSAVKSYAAFQSNLIDGTGRYVGVTLADGTPLPIRTTKGNETRCEPDCRLVFETVVVEIPDAVLRAVPAEGLAIDYRLDNGSVTRATAPAAYVRGYLQAIDTPR